ncbi:ABC transporter substrate-binding protein [Curtobacterium sp. ODYSSEY 48 V2]|uniref:ABC transporter substrate-binding protein n=1 Tax=unclassified Curtobacterium TaxID=257496 RepID=UPI001AE73CC0|nr:MULTISPECIES: ABC transporter substrate-binding protein [unclassified Curtobacterium]MBP1302670.1 polar amino acid transport system substrate-binding protein [Curtobacterium sp. 1310]MCM3506571.1 ABC transporter substrate-binding protein [Curtobacterium sp. ODYSSEY 48 V2]MDT0211590.1 ABC transporter substrate-binding protein [Curtobacterium sp. BRD11]
MTRTRRLSLAVATATVAALALAACSAGGSSAGSDGTVTDGKLTIATGQPAYSPWVEDDDPQSGKGFESAVAYAVAKEMGYAKGDVVWKRSTFDSAIAPGPKDWDLNVQQFSIDAKRKKAVDMSTPYYTTTQAVVTTSGSKAAKDTTVAALKGDTIGVASGSTSISSVKDVLGVTPQVFNSNDDAVLALQSGQIDAIVTDLPTAFYMAAAQLDDGTVSAQFPEDGSGDQFGFVLPKGSALTSKVDKALEALESDGTLADLQTKWLSSETNTPVLK